METTKVHLGRMNVVFSSRGFRARANTEAKLVCVLSGETHVVFEFGVAEGSPVSVDKQKATFMRRIAKICAALGFTFGEAEDYLGGGTKWLVDARLASS